MRRVILHRRGATLRDAMQRRGMGWLLLVALLPLPASAQDGLPPLRVRLLEKAAPTALVVSGDGGALRFFAGEGPGNVLTALGPGEQARLDVRDDEVRVTLDDLTFYARSLRLETEDDAFLQVEVAEGRARPKPRHYAGHLTLDVDHGGAGALRLVNHAPVETYVAHVVAREYGFDDLEGAKAMAVLARTYALRALATPDGAYDLVDNLSAQKYDGAGPLTRAARDAVRLTHGEVLTYRGDLAEAVYFSSSGGHTANNEDVWNGEPVPYLRGVPDPYDSASPHAGWRTTVPRDRLLRTLSEAYGFEVEGFHLGPRSQDGRVQTIELLRGDRPARTLPSNEFRLLVNRHFGGTTLKSTLFDARRDGDRYVFTGNGFGHGVGLSQYGALEMSRRGFRYPEILAFYYQGVQIQPYGEASDLPVATEAPPGTPPRKATRRAGW